MNIANVFTLSRILIVPFFVFFLLKGYNENWNETYYLIAFILFAVASVTDFFDGYIARKFNMITDLGKFLDPIADKVLVVAALICFIPIGWAPIGAVIAIITREFIISGFRLAVVSKNNKAVIAADIWGKIKTAFTMLVICAFLILLAFWESVTSAVDIRADLPKILVYICTVLTVFSGFTMIYKNRKLFTGAGEPPAAILPHNGGDNNYSEGKNG